MLGNLKVMRGLCWAAVGKALKTRSLHDLEFACFKAAGAADKIESRELRSIPALWPDQCFGPLELLSLRVGKYEDGMMPPEDLIMLVYFLVRLRPSVVLEIGTYMGHTTRAIAENCPDALVHTLDLPEDFNLAADPAALEKDDHHLIGKRVVGREFKGLPCAARIRQHFGDSAVWDFRHVAGATFFLIDGAHTYDYVKNDTLKCMEICPSGGFYLWHDVDDRHPGVVQYMAELRASGRDIKRVVNTQLAFWHDQ